MKISSILLKLFPILLLVTVSKLNGISRRKRANLDNFNILLNIYKMNPLKHSKVFNTFSNRILLPRPDELRPALNYNSDESSKRNDTTDFKHVEEIHQSTIPSLDKSDLILTDLSALFNSSFDKIAYNRLKNVSNFDLDRNSSEELKRDLRSNRKNVGLKVYNLNARSEDNRVNYRDAGVVIVK